MTNVVTNEEIEALWALTKDVAVVPRTAHPTADQAAAWQTYRSATNPSAFLSLLSDLKAARARIAKLEAAAPVMLSVLARLADEATDESVRECTVHYCERDPDHLDVWLDAETARKERG